MAEGGTSFAVVTGASSGIGLELAREFVDHGFDVLICAEDAELADAASQLAAGGNQVDVVRADLATRQGVEELVSAVAETGRPVDALALNAASGTVDRSWRRRWRRTSASSISTSPRLCTWPNGCCRRWSRVARAGC